MKKKDQLIEKIRMINDGLEMRQRLLVLQENYKKRLEEYKDTKESIIDAKKIAIEENSQEGVMEQIVEYLKNAFNNSSVQSLKRQINNVKAEEFPLNKKIIKISSIIASIFYFIVFICCGKFSFILPIILGILIGVIIGFVSKYLKNNKASEAAKEEKQRLQSKLDIEKERIKNNFNRYIENEFKENFIKNCEIINTADTKVDENKVNIDRNIEKSRLLNEKIEALTKAIIEEAKPYITEQDIYKIPVILYLLESNRADTIKEALQLSDNKEYFEQIKETTLSMGEKLGAKIDNLTETTIMGTIGIAKMIDSSTKEVKKTIKHKEEMESRKFATLQAQLMELSGLQEESNYLAAANLMEQKENNRLARHNLYANARMINLEKENNDIQEELLREIKNN